MQYPKIGSRVSVTYQSTRTFNILTSEGFVVADRYPESKLAIDLADGRGVIRIPWHFVRIVRPHHGRVVEARIEAADHTNVHPLRKMPVQSTEQSMNAVREAVAQARADEQAELLGGPGQYDRLTGRKATARTPEADLVDEAHRFDYIRAAVEDEHSHPSIDAGPDGPVTPTTW